MYFKHLNKKQKISFFFQNAQFKNKVSFVLALFFSSYVLTAQTFKGRVVDINNQAISYANVQIEELKTGKQTDSDGNFSLPLSAPGEFTLKVSFIGYENYQARFSVASGETKVLNITLKPGDTKLAEVVINGTNEIRKVREQAFNISAIDMKQLYNGTQNINKALNRTTGIRVREEGGLGSNFTFSVNGFTGKQVKFFIDGVPMDNFGTSLSLNNLPVNLAERIEIYKGVVPVWLGSDALGGAVNVVTNQRIKQYIDASYSIGSFNTHKAAINTRYTHEKSGFTLNVNAFYNYSDNNYKVDVQIPNPETGKYDQTRSLPRFHDTYHSSMGQIEMGFINKPWADKLMAGIIVAENRKDIQHGLNMDDVAGMAFNSSKSIIATLKYKKENLFINGLSLAANANYSRVNAGVTDTSSRKYDWFGNYTTKTFGVTSGELSYNKTLFEFKDKSAIGTANLAYKINNQNNISLNHTYSYYERKGTDPISRYPIPFQIPNVLDKNISGLAYEYNSDNKHLSATVFTKLYKLMAKTVDAEWGDFSSHETSYTKGGYGLAVLYRFTPSVHLKASYENCWRMPEGEEMFGDGLLLQNNAFLRPEHSHNVNLGLMAGTLIRKHKIEGEISFIYRRSGDFIRLESDGILSQYSNLDSVRTLGAEFQTKYTYNDFFFIEVNGTYQNIINVNEYDKGIKSFVYLDRLPNIPYLFGNSDIGIRWKDAFSPKDLLVVTIGASYVKQFYLFWPSQGSTDSKFFIPSQFTQNASISYSLRNGTYNIAFECSNISNAKVYDNFRLQKPGRSFQVKFRYYFNK